MCCSGIINTWLNFYLNRQRLPKKQWWLKLRPLLRILAKHDSTYEEEGLYITVEEECESDAAVVWEKILYVLL